MPSLTVKAFAELLHLPGYEHVRILHEQKYPQKQPQTFRTPFYSPALTAIRGFYRAGNSRPVLDAARHAIGRLGLPARRSNNLRVLDQFEVGSQYMRGLKPCPRPRCAAKLGPLELRLSLDMTAQEATKARLIYYNCRAVALDGATARTALEVAHWVLEQNGTIVPFDALEFVEVSTNLVRRIRRRRPVTIQRMKQSAKVIDALWQTI